MALMQRSVGLTVIAGLALAQGVLGILRAFKLFQIGIDLAGRGVFFIPLMGAITFARGGLVVVIALLYILFAWGALTRRHWAWWVGLVASLVNGLVVLSTVSGGGIRSAGIVLGRRPRDLCLLLVGASGASGAQKLARDGSCVEEVAHLPEAPHSFQRQLVH